MNHYARMMVLLFGIIGTALVLQSAFDSSDHNKASRAVRGYRVGTGPTLEERLGSVAPGGAWSTEITHGCRGIVRVDYRVANTDYAFDYDVPEHGIHPGNPAAERLLKELPRVAPAPTK